MRIRILSDLHLECFKDGRDLPDSPVDATILAGDIHMGTQGLTWAAEHLADTPVIYVPGNHEYYGHSMPSLRSELKSEAKRLGIHLLDNDSVDIGGVRFLGTTLWTDFQLYADQPDHDPALTYAHAIAVMHDFQNVEQPEGDLFTPQESVRLHNAAVEWLDSQLAQPFSGPRIVISHHAPLPECIPAVYQGDALSPAFASRLSRLMGKAEVWVHGHVHEAIDRVFEGTRVVANPGGYPHELDPASRVPDRVIEIPNRTISD